MIHFNAQKPSAASEALIAGTPTPPFLASPPEIGIASLRHQEKVFILLFYNFQ
jgi:hypothetical protein